MPTRKRILKRCFSLGFAFIAVLAGLFLVHWYTVPRISKESYEKIEGGMTKAQVIDLLHGNPHYSPGESKEVFRGGTLGTMMMESEGYVWVSSNERIYVRFNPEEMAVGKMWSEKCATSFFEKLRRWLRFG